MILRQTSSTVTAIPITDRRRRSSTAWITRSGSYVLSAMALHRLDRSVLPPSPRCGGAGPFSYRNGIYCSIFRSSLRPSSSHLCPFDGGPLESALSPHDASSHACVAAASGVLDRPDRHA